MWQINLLQLVGSHLWMKFLVIEILEESDQFFLVCDFEIGQKQQQNFLIFVKSYPSDASSVSEPKKFSHF